jgi:hypothetical protein
MDSRGRYSDRFQKWFSRFLAKAGANTPGTSHHSFRHNFRDALRDAQVSDEIVDGLMGMDPANDACGVWQRSAHCRSGRSGRSGPVSGARSVAPVYGVKLNEQASPYRHRDRAGLVLV